MNNCISFSKLIYKMPDPLLYRLMAWKMKFIGEPEAKLLPKLVDRNKRCLDIGANRGAYTYWLSKLSTQVFAFEPLPHLVDYLKRIVSDNVKVEPWALSNCEGTAVCRIPVINNRMIEGEASIVVMPDGKTEDMVVNLRRLDDMDIHNIGFIKIDVEGAEAAVIQGGILTLKRESPVVLIEIEQRHIKQPIDTIFRLLTDIGYYGYFFRNGRLIDIKHFSLEHDQNPILRTRINIMKRRYVNNFIFAKNVDNLPIIG